jgi:site-specific DNA-cytosine methylase
MEKLRVLSLFAGIGGFDLGLERTGGFSTVAFCEIEPFAQRVLKKHWPHVHCFDDVRKLTGADIGPVDVICGGYPCQPFSTAGKRQGKEDDRHLWPEFMRLVVELRPTWVIGENVAGHISMGLDDVLADLEAEGYACRTFVVPACAVGASHRRDRVWTVAHRNGKCWASVRGQREDAKGESFGGQNDRGRSRQDAERQVSNGGARKNTGDVAHAIGGRRQGQGQPLNASDQAPGGKGQADEFINGGQRGERRVEPGMGRGFDGFPAWLHGFDLTISQNLVAEYGAKSKTNADQILRTLRLSVREKADQWSAGGPLCVSPEAVLLAYLRELEIRESDEGGLSLEGAQNAEMRVRGVRWESQSASAPCGPGPHKQHAEERPDSVQTLSRLLALHSEKAWAAYRGPNAFAALDWESGIARVRPGVKDRAARLKALGNAVHPDIPLMIGRAILAAEQRGAV